MSKQIHEESQRRKQVKFRAGESLVEEFDEAIGDKSRAEALRELMQETVEGPDPDGRLDVPDDEHLADAYRWLVQYTTRRAKPTVRLRTARRNLAQQQNVEKADVRSDLLVGLAKRGYITIRDAPPGQRQSGCVIVHEHRRTA